MDEDLAKLESDPGSVRAKAYDLVINGYECGGGTFVFTIRKCKAACFAVLGMTPEQASSASAFCSMRCAWAHRRTAASPWALTA